MKYTRYADDILISSHKLINDQQFAELDTRIKKRLKILELGINDEKFLRVNFGTSVNHIRYVGINIVQGERENYLSVGKTYVYETAKEYLRYLDKARLQERYGDMIGEEEQKKLKNDIFYERMILIGKLGFIRMVEGERGVERFRKRLKVHDIELMNEKIVI